MVNSLLLRGKWKYSREKSNVKFSTKADDIKSCSAFNENVWSVEHFMFRYQDNTCFWVWYYELRALLLLNTWKLFESNTSMCLYITLPWKNHF